MKFKKIMAAAVASVMAIGTMAVAANAYTAGLIFQTNAWNFRNNINQSKAYWTDPDFDDKMVFETWKYTDVEITTDGTYTVSFEKNVMEDCKDGPETYWNFLKIQTNIPYADISEDFNITVDKLTVDGVEIADAKNAIVTEDDLNLDDYSDISGINDKKIKVVTVGFVNTWNDAQTVMDATASFGGKVEVTFTVTGLDEAVPEGDGEDGESGEPEGGNNGNTSAPTDDKQNADTGIEGVAVVAGIAVLAVGAVVVAKKRK